MKQPKENSFAAYSDEHPRAALTVDCVVFGWEGGDLQVLLVKRGAGPAAATAPTTAPATGPVNDPLRARWALPGGFVHLDETLDDAARRALAEKTGMTRLYLEQLYTFGELNRDPRERVVSVAYYALVKLSSYRAPATSNALAAKWWPVSELPPLAFDHKKIFESARERLRGKVRWQPLGFELLPPKFTLSQLQRLYEAILEKPLDKRNFRKKILGMELLVELDEVEEGVAHRAARLHRFDPRKYQSLKKAGVHFEM